MSEIFRSSDKFVTGNSDSSVTLFDGVKPLKTKRLNSDRENKYDVKLDYNNGQIVVAEDCGKVKVLNENLESVKQFDGTIDTVQSTFVNETHLVIGDRDGCVSYYTKNCAKPKVSLCINFLEFEFIFQTYKHNGCVTSVQINENLVISGSEDNTVQVWDMNECKKLWELDHGDLVSDTILCDDRLITCCEDASVRVLDLKSGEQLHRLEHPSPCINADLSRSKSLLAVASESAVVLWDFKNATKIKEFALEPDVKDVRFNPSGDKLIVALEQGEVVKIEMN